MAMSEEEFTFGAIDMLQRFGIRATRVPTETDTRTPDLRGVGGSDIYAIELKQRDSDRVLNSIPDIAPLTAHQLAPFGLTRDQAVQSLIREGVRQLRGELNTTFRIIWVHCEGFDSDTDQMQLQNAFLGTEYLLDRTTGGQVYLCHFFSESDFWRYRDDLDGAIVSRQVDNDNVSLSLLLNPHSPRFDRLRGSGLAASIEANMLVDVLREEESGQCLIADCDTDRSHSDIVLAHLCTKYAMNLMRIPIHRYGGVVRL